ncbi:hypothetical protein MPSI1_001802 [Malassezia psittaci]|uniref:Cullin family profile domain-containing protein n=1 Tax=Malassezia psittaci TaxID=1821823 RepID=A0AAF0FA49_9BASI|nr:hypothetical protein MPSI1_001802 [Malassezia psittaci]
MAYAVQLREILAQELPMRQADVISWYLKRCEKAFFAFCTEALSCLSNDAIHRAVPQAIEACYAWVGARYELLCDMQHGLGLEEASDGFFLRCQTQFTSAMSQDKLEILPKYFAHGMSQIQNASQCDAECIQVAAQLRVLGFSMLVQGIVTTTATNILEAAVKQETRGQREHTLNHAALPAMRAFLQEQLIPSLIGLLDARPKGFHLLDRTINQEVWDLSASHIQDESSQSSLTQESLYMRLEYRLSLAIGHARLAQLFDIVGVYPQSRGALSDLMVWLDISNERVYIAEAFSTTVRARLLHPGVNTHAILVYYVNIVYCLRLVDTSGVILSKVLPPVQRYLRTRSDIIPAVVNTLLGDDDAFELLRMELASASSITAYNAHLRDEEEAQSRPEYWTDPTWSPRPVEAGPEYSQMRSRDVIDLLVSIFDDHNGFIQALEHHTAQQLVRTKKYDTSRAQRNNEIFKRRFGAHSLHNCDVMLADIASSQDSDHQFHTASSQSLVSEVCQNMHPMVISRQFWPDIDTKSFTLPRSFAEALDTYADHYAEVQRKRKIKWLPFLGTVDVDIEMDDGRWIHASVPPLEAAVAELVAGLAVPADTEESNALSYSDMHNAEHVSDYGSVPDSRAKSMPRIVTADNVAAALAVDRQKAVEALRFWASYKILQELAPPAIGSFAITEHTT